MQKGSEFIGRVNWKAYFYEGAKRKQGYSVGTSNGYIMKTYRIPMHNPTLGNVYMKLLNLLKKVNFLML